MIAHSYKKSDLLKFKCDECDFWGPNAQTMKMHFRRLHCEKVSCGICDLEMRDIETLDTHTLTCQMFKCNWCDASFSDISELKCHSKQQHKGKNYITHYKRMRNNDDFFSDDFFPFKDLVWSQKLNSIIRRKEMLKIDLYFRMPEKFLDKTVNVFWTNPCTFVQKFNKL